MGAITPLNEALQGMNVPFMHPDRFSELSGCSVSQIKNGFTDGSIPFCTPFAKKDSKRPTRYVFLKRWLEVLEANQPSVGAETSSQKAGTNHHLLDGAPGSCE